MTFAVEAMTDAEVERELTELQETFTEGDLTAWNPC